MKAGGKLPTCSGIDEPSTSAMTALSSELLANVATERRPWPSNTPKAENGTEPAWVASGWVAGGQGRCHW